MAKKNQNTSADLQASKDPRVELLRLYVKDLSLQIPEGAKAFQVEWKPELNFEISTQSKALAEPNHFEISIHLKCTNTCSGTVVFVVEIIQAGVFNIENLDEAGQKQAFSTVCPNIIYPFVREAVGDLVVRSGFPQLNLSAINFEAVQGPSETEIIQ